MLINWNTISFKVPNVNPSPCMPACVSVSGSQPGCDSHQIHFDAIIVGLQTKRRWGKRNCLCEVEMRQILARQTGGFIWKYVMRDHCWGCALMIRWEGNEEMHKKNTHSIRLLKCEPMCLICCYDHETPISFHLETKMNRCLKLREAGKVKWGRCGDKHAGAGNVVEWRQGNF